MKRLIATSVVAGVAALAVAAPAAADVGVAPTSRTFGAQQVGTTSDPQVVTVTVSCTSAPVPPACSTNDTFTPNPQFTGVNIGDFSQTNNCGAGVSSVDAVSTRTCAFSIRFKPTAVGNRTATLTLGSSSTGPQQPSPVLLSGTAVVAPGTGTPTTGTPTTGAGGGGTIAKKCKKKKKRSAAAAKKCKKKKK